MPKADPTDLPPSSGQTYLNEDGDNRVIPERSTRPPSEAIDVRRNDSQAAHDAVRKAVQRLSRSRAPFTVKDVVTLSGRGKSFLYAHDGRKSKPNGTPECAICTPENNLKNLAQEAAAASRGEAAAQAANEDDKRKASYRERAKQAEALAKKLHREIGQRDAIIRDLKAQLRDPDGTLLIAVIAQLRKDLAAANRDASTAHGKLRRMNQSLNAARDNYQHEQARNVAEFDPSRRGPEVLSLTPGEE